jgi:potassium/hydrogen antiporter
MHRATGGTVSMGPMNEPTATGALVLALGLLLALAGLASPASRRLGVPALLFFLLLGIAAGSEGIGGIWFDDAGLAFRLGTLALVVILFDGGLNTSPVVFRRALAPAAVLATLGVVVTAALTAGIGVLLGLPWPAALLVGAVVSSTDAAAVFSVIRASGIGLEQRASATLEVESGLNDPMAMLLTIAITELVLGALTPVGVGWMLVTQAIFGVAVGVGMGVAGRVLLRVVRLPAAGLYPILTVGIAFLSFGTATVLGGSGLLAVFLTGFVLASGALPYRAGIRRVLDAFAWLSQILMFLVLGLLVFPTRIVPIAGVGFALALALAFVARPLAVFACLAPFRFARGERVFMAWVGLRGAVPIVLATYPLLRGVEAGPQVFDLVFFVVLVTSFLPGATVAWSARRLGVARDVVPAPAASIELVSLRDLPGEFLWYRVSPASAVAGAFIRELPLPEGSVVTFSMRGGQVIVARGSTELCPGDEVGRSCAAGRSCCACAGAAAWP